MAPESFVDRASHPPADPLPTGLGWAGGVVIALLTVIVPLTSVVLDRQSLAAKEGAVPAFSTGSLLRPTP